MSTPTIIPMMAYADGPAAMDWLAEAFGFNETKRWLADDGHLEHGEMESGDGVIMIATPDPRYEGPARHREHCPITDAWMSSPYVVDGLLVHVDDVDTHFARARPRVPGCCPRWRSRRSDGSTGPRTSKDTGGCSSSRPPTTNRPSRLRCLHTPTNVDRRRGASAAG